MKAIAETLHDFMQEYRTSREEKKHEEQGLAVKPAYGGMPSGYKLPAYAYKTACDVGSLMAQCNFHLKMRAYVQSRWGLSAASVYDKAVKALARLIRKIRRTSSVRRRRDQSSSSESSLKGKVLCTHSSWAVWHGA